MVSRTLEPVHMSGSTAKGIKIADGTKVADQLTSTEESIPDFLGGYHVTAGSLRVDQGDKRLREPYEHG